MAYTYDRSTDSIVISGWEKGIAPSPNLGIADIKCANISTLSEEALCNFARALNSEKFSASARFSATMPAMGSLVSYVITANPTNITFLQPGNWIKILTSGVAELAVGTAYFIDFASTIVANVTVSAAYDNTGGANSITSTLGGSFTFEFLPNTAQLGGIMTKPVASATEYYYDAGQAAQNRYYVMDTEGHVWVNDTAVTNNGSNYWALIDVQTAREWAYGGGTTEQATGIAVYNGFLIQFIGELIGYKLTSMLGANPRVPGSTGWAQGLIGVYGQNPSATLNQIRGSANPHSTFNSKAGALYWTDSSFVGSLFATANTGGNPNVFSYGKATSSSSSGLLLTLTALISGATPEVGMPITFYTDGTLPPGISADTIYYVLAPALAGTSLAFRVSATKGGSAVSFAGAGTGNLWYNTLDPNLSTTFIFSPQALTLPQENDVSQALIEIGGQILVGCQSNALYFWDGVSITPNGYLFLPEANVAQMVNANNMAFIFAGSRGNIYISNGNTSSIVTTIPDYVTGRPDPYFSWGGAMYARGRIWFSVQDQTASISGNCGGIWSFVPTQNFYPGQDTGLALHLEHQNSYGAYNGMANLLINEVNQNFQGIQYFSAWTSSVTSPTYGIDMSSSVPYTGSQTLIETDLIPIGDYLEKGNFTSIVTKYDAPLSAGESVQLLYRNDIQSAFQAWPAGSITTGLDSAAGSLGTRFDIPFAQQTMVQFRILLTSTATSPSYVRLREIRIKKSN